MHFEVRRAEEVTEKLNDLAKGGWRVIFMTRMSLYGQFFTVFLERERS